ncbi:Nuclear receptor domain-containing protein [Caenorhabditis elegans]|uniref:Nuclear receptor domain-containing protein n=1 Tax=Caenorhabditis elegans TaxID=6239 RepID=Q9XVC7_CAEEL|nr:Nuclear receptor domain-containing protein [Caenorhabditis elegans]CAB03929.2 Nuclear receptor domain-containing protein [Caenorhabditis elegans]|eukprot:NP_492919.2 Nuclear Hormone Receptor family [Caenorhabditis elegans]
MERSYTEKAACQVCQSTERTRLYFGITSCAACAAFFRRSDGIQYMCTANNSCTIAYDIKFFCRACRYESCVRAGMRRDNVRKHRTHQNQAATPGAVIPELHLRLTPTDSLGSSSSSRSTSPDDSEEFSDILDNTLHVSSITDLMIVSAHHEGSSTESCLNCPGVDMLDKEDVEVLLKYFKFSNTWIDSIFASLISPNQVELIQCDHEDIAKFINHSKSTLGFSLSHLNLNIIEYSVFKSFCIWKLVYHETSIAMKIMAQEHFEGVTSALRKYYRKESKMNDLEVATRIGDITLQIITVSNLYNDMIRLYHQIGVEF